MGKAMLSPSMMGISEWHGTKKVFEVFHQGGIEFLHADVMDGEFVPNLMMGSESIRNLRKACPPLSMIEEVPCDVDGVLVMTVNPGFAGQKLVPQTLDKVSRVRKMLDDTGRPDALIEIDGNLSFENGPKMHKAGADIFVCGTSSVFSKTATAEENIARFRQCVADEKEEI